MPYQLNSGRVGPAGRGYQNETGEGEERSWGISPISLPQVAYPERIKYFPWFKVLLISIFFLCSDLAEYPRPLVSVNPHLPSGPLS